MRIPQEGIYRHFKGTEYRLVGIARHSETMEDMAVYHALHTPQSLWVRPLAMWSERVDRDGYQGPRFQWLREAP